MLPTDPDKHEEYRAKIRAARARQAPSVPKGTKFTAAHRAAISRSAKSSPLHRSKRQAGDRNPNYKGGFIEKNGYRIVQVGSRQVPEHRVVMERMIGRPLLPEETVHHKNGVRSDNRESNLELWSSRQPKGQRVIDKVRFAREILALYDGCELDEEDYLS